ncbi:MAG: hypothetical protein QY310_00700 [Candidatus Jettenia sp. CY-1]|nr:MAG: hypothetical protein QY310_00700 [Candidatus Jettenia sp. CY-1]
MYQAKSIIPYERGFLLVKIGLPLCKAEALPYIGSVAAKGFMKNIQGYTFF